MTDQEKIEEIIRLLDEAYGHYMEFGDGHHKSSDGYVQVYREFGNHWDRQGDRPIDTGLKVHIYSYVFCDEGRSQDFDSLDEALETVREWHRDELLHEYTDGW